MNRCHRNGLRSEKVWKRGVSPTRTVNERLTNTMLMGYARVSKADGSHSLDLQRDALVAAGSTLTRFTTTTPLARRRVAPGLEVCPRALRKGDVLVV